MDQSQSQSQNETNANPSTETILNNNDDNTYNSTASILYFLVVTIIYFVLRFFFGSSESKESDDSDSSKIFSMNTMLTLLYFLVVVAGEFGINLSISKKVCGTNQYISAGLYTGIPWTFMFGLLQGMLKLFPGWLIPFSNTIGYLFVKILGIGKLFNDILSSNADKIPGVDSKTKITTEALEHIYNDRSLLINEITQENFERFWNNMSSAGLFKSDVNISLKNKLLSYIKIKNLVAECLWYILTGLLIISVSFNLMINSECDRSVGELMTKSDILSKSSNNPPQSTTAYKDTE